MVSHLSGGHSCAAALRFDTRYSSYVSAMECQEVLGFTPPQAFDELPLRPLLALSTATPRVTSDSSLLLVALPFAFTHSDTVYPATSPRLSFSCQAHDFVVGRANGSRDGRSAAHLRDARGQQPHSGGIYQRSVQRPNETLQPTVATSGGSELEGLVLATAAECWRSAAQGCNSLLLGVYACRIYDEHLG